MIKLSTVIAGSLAAGLALGVNAGTLDEVKSRGELKCGVSTGLAGFSQKDEEGKWSGIDVDACRAVAAAVLGDADKVSYKPLTAKERFTALQSGEIDMLSRNTTWTLTRDTALGLNFTATTYYDGQGFMVKKDLEDAAGNPVTSALQLGGASVCIQAGTTTELNLADYFRANNMAYKAITFDTSDQTRGGFDSNRCDVLTSDQSQLYALRIGLTNPDGAMVLPEVISKEPLGPVVRQGDDPWFNVVRWSLFALIEAEFLGIDSNSVDQIKDTGNPSQKRLLGLEGTAGEKLGLPEDWAYNIVKQVGNYGEVFERNVGSGSKLKIARGLNAQWNKGGILYSPPVR
jgi:general L-amino acid transport system substrate-binding protein